MEFSQIVKSLRLERGWSQQDVADRVGLNKMTISQYENGKRKPSFEMVEALAEIFHVDMNYLLGFTDKTEKPAGGARGLVSRLAALEEEEEQLVLEIQRAEIKRPRLTHEVVEAWLRPFRVGDVTDDDFRARLVDTFIARVELRNDEALIFYNIREKGPHSRVRVRPEWWSPRSGTRTPEIFVLRDYIVLKIAV